MRAKQKTSKVPNRQRQATELLEQAMKQPGIKTAMDVFEAAEKLTQASTEHSNYIGWTRFPSFFSSCDTTIPA